MAAVTITVRKDGNYKVEGDVVLLDHDGNVIPLPQGKPFFTLCRCGASSRKPFCDGTHSKIGFKGAEEAKRDFDAQQAEQAKQAHESTPSSTTGGPGPSGTPGPVGA